MNLDGKLLIGRNLVSSYKPQEEPQFLWCTTQSKKREKLTLILCAACFTQASQRQTRAIWKGDVTCILGRGPSWIALRWYGASVSTNKRSHATLTSTGFTAGLSSARGHTPNITLGNALNQSCASWWSPRKLVINLMILRDLCILQNLETRATGQPSVVTLSDMQDQRQMLQIGRPHQGPHKLCEKGHLTVQLGGGLDNECPYQSPLQLPHVLPLCGLWSTTPRRPPGVHSRPSPSQRWDEHQMPEGRNLPPPAYQVVPRDWSCSCRPRSR